MTKEIPILFNDEMVRAIREGRKTQTRRPMKGVFNHNGQSCIKDRDDGLPSRIDIKNNVTHMSPFGKPDDVLYVREASAQCKGVVIDGKKPYMYRATYKPPTKGIGKGYIPKWTPSIHMPKSAARIYLKVKRVWVERLQDISAEEIWKEGISHDCDKYGSIVHTFADLWNSIYGTWDDNPWVWCCEFERIEK